MNSLKDGQKVLIKSDNVLATVTKCECPSPHTLVHVVKGAGHTRFSTYLHIPDDDLLSLPDNATQDQIEALRSLLK